MKLVTVFLIISLSSCTYSSLFSSNYEITFLNNHIKQIKAGRDCTEKAFLRTYLPELLKIIKLKKQQSFENLTPCDLMRNCLHREEPQLTQEQKDKLIDSVITHIINARANKELQLAIQTNQEILKSSKKQAEKRAGEYFLNHEFIKAHLDSEI